MQDQSSDVPVKASAPRTKRRFSDLRIRLISSFCLMAVVTAMLWFGGIWFGLMLAATLGLALYEHEMLITKKRPEWRFFICQAPALLGSVLFFKAWPIITAALFSLSIILSFLMYLPHKSGLKRLPGVMIICLVGLGFYGLRLDPEPNHGFWVIAFLFAAVWGTDAGAYFAGQFFGGAKLNPDISPSKTWSGAIGGLVAGSFNGALWWWMGTESTVWIGFLIALVLSLSTQIGDLVQSMIKRHYRIKDMSDLIPGHGGVLDRIDGLILAIVPLVILALLRSDQPSMAQGVLQW